eukprot:SAG31_NODE_1490_length_8134_cov_3.892968_4_plen_184_part_00
MNTGGPDGMSARQLELTASSWISSDPGGGVVFGEETTVARGNWIQSKDVYTRPCTVTAEIRSTANPECITMSLFAPDHSKNGPYSIETGGWSNKIRIFPGDYREDVGGNTEWHSVRIEATATGQVRYSLDDVVKYEAEDVSLQSGTTQFVAGCVDMAVRNVVVSQTDFTSVTKMPPESSSGGH